MSRGDFAHPIRDSGEWRVDCYGSDRTVSQNRQRPQRCGKFAHIVYEAKRATLAKGGRPDKLAHCEKRLAILKRVRVGHSPTPELLAPA
jgi:hypothetical protein